MKRFREVTRKFRVWTKCIGDTLQVETGWSTITECRKFIQAKWGHHPPFAFISKAKTEKDFRQSNP